jgi:hypothetical protein
MTRKYQPNIKSLAPTTLDSKGRSLMSIVLPITLALLQSVPAWSSSEQTSEVLKLEENKRIEASICSDSMNRIAVANDRITQIFGDEGTFESQNDESTGQVFLKPTADNGPKDLSLTLITEQGITQDLTLKPTAKSAKTIILDRGPSRCASLGRDPLGRDPSLQDTRNQDFVSNTPSADRHTIHEGFRPEEPRIIQLLTLLKQAMSGQLLASESSRSEDKPRKHPILEGCSLTPSQSWQAGPYVVHAFHVENVTETPLEIEEKDFYQPGDLALSFGTRAFGSRAAGTRNPQNYILAVEGKTILYVVCYRKADLS